MSPGQGLHLHAVAIATPTMTNTRAHLCQVGEAQRNRSPCFRHSGELLTLDFDPSGSASQGAARGREGCAVSEVRVALDPPGLRIFSYAVEGDTSVQQNILAANFFHSALQPLRQLLYCSQQCEAGVCVGGWCGGWCWNRSTGPASHPASEEGPGPIYGQLPHLQRVTPSVLLSELLCV